MYQNLPSIALDTETSDNIPFIATTTDENLDSNLYDLTIAEDFFKVKEIAENPNIIKVFHNAIYDIYCLSRIEIIVVPPIDDTMIMATLVNENYVSRKLKWLARNCLDEECAEERALSKLKTKLKSECKKKGIPFTWDMIPRDTLYPYAIKDPEYTMMLSYYFKEPMKQYRKLYEFEMKMTFIVVDMIKEGLRIDRPYVKSMMEEYTKKVSFTLTRIEDYLLDNDLVLCNTIKRKTYKGIYSYASRLGLVPDDSEIIEVDDDFLEYKYPIEYNPGSPTQTREVLENFEIFTPTSGKKGEQGTGKDVLTPWLKRNPNHKHRKFVNILEDFRFYSKQLSTYYDPFYNKHTSESDDIAHFLMYQSGARTGRFSAERIQTIPRPYEDTQGKSRRIRDAFIPPERYMIVSGDYDQIEMRVFADRSDCTNLINDINAGYDCHSGTAIRIFGRSLYDTNPKHYRFQAKWINFGIIYGMGANALADLLELPYIEAYEYLEEYYSNYPVKQFISAVIGQLYRSGYIRIKYDSPKMSFMRDYRVPKKLAYKGVNMIVQGTSAYVLKFAMKRIAEYIVREKLDIKMVLTLHDELFFYIDKQSYCRDLLLKLTDKMEDHVTFKVPILATIKVSDKSWGDCKEIDLRTKQVNMEDYLQQIEVGN